MDMDMGADKEDGGFLDMMFCINADKWRLIRIIFFFPNNFFYLLWFLNGSIWADYPLNKRRVSIYYSWSSVTVYCYCRA